MENDRLKQPKLCFDDAEFEMKDFIMNNDRRSAEHDRIRLQGTEAAEKNLSSAENGMD